MDLFKVYGQWDIEPVRGLDTTIWDKNGTRYTDLYGGHAVISIGHSNPHYIKVVSEQLSRLGFYSNAVQNSCRKNWAADWERPADMTATPYSCATPEPRPMKMPSSWPHSIPAEAVSWHSANPSTAGHPEPSPLRTIRHCGLPSTPPVM